MLYVVASDRARNSPDDSEVHPTAASFVLESADTHRFLVYRDTGLDAVAGFLHQIENKHAVTEFYINARGTPLHAEGLVFRIYCPCSGMGSGVKMHGSHNIRPGSGEPVADQFIREFMAYVLRRFHPIHFFGAEDGSIGNLVPVILCAHLRENAGGKPVEQVQ